MGENSSTPFHIALFLPSLEGGGAQRVTLSLAQGLIERGGIRVDIVLGRSVGPFLSEIPSGVRLVDLNVNRMLSTVLPLARYLRAEKPDALISSLDYANVAAIIASFLSRARVRTAIVTHIHLSSSMARLSLAKRMVFRFLMRSTYPYAHSIVSVSRGVAEDMAQLLCLPSSRIRVIYNPVVHRAMMNDALQPTSHPWLSDTNRPVILAVGRLTVQKDFPTLLRAVALLNRHSFARLIILGEGEQRSELQQLVVELGLQDIVDMPGFVPNPYCYMSRATVLALSSRWEALPTVLIEAMSSGIPVVSTDCPCGPNEVLAGGKYGALVPVGDVPALAAALVDAIEGRRSPAPPESWRPYLIEHATSKYLALFGISPGEPEPSASAAVA